MSQEAVVAYFKLRYYPNMCQEGLRNQQKTSEHRLEYETRSLTTAKHVVRIERINASIILFGKLWKMVTCKTGKKLEE
jgi:hypothetical protein